MGLQPGSPAEALATLLTAVRFSSSVAPPAALKTRVLAAAHPARLARVEFLPCVDGQRNLTRGQFSRIPPTFPTCGWLLSGGDSLLTATLQPLACPLSAVGSLMGLKT